MGRRAAGRSRSLTLGLGFRAREPDESLRAESLGASGDRFAFNDFAAIASTWQYGKGDEGDRRHWRRCWDRAGSDDGGHEQAKPTDAWPEPIPLVAEHEKPERYPIEALPATIRAAVMAYQRFGQQPIEMVACALLSTTSLACQGLADVSRDGNLVGPCSLSFLVVAQSGERKTAADRRARRAIEQWQRDKEAELAHVIAGAERQLALWQAEHDGMLLKLKRLAGSTKKEDEHHPRAAGLHVAR